jgi:AraC family transcriptional regulator of arabinose operon
MSESKSQRAAAFAGEALPCTCLYSELYTSDNAYPIAPHRHEFWQFDIFFKGGCLLKLADRSVRIRGGQAILIPPGVDHAFDYPVGTRVVFLRFAAQGSGSTVQVIDWSRVPSARALVRALLALFSGGQYIPQESMGTASCLILALIGELQATGRRPGQSSPLVSETKKLIHAQGAARVAVSRIAAQAGYSAGHLSAAFRKAEGISLRQYMARERAQAAARMVLYSGQPLKQIAGRMGFSDAFAFSKFFKRMLGRAPSTFRGQTHDQP